MGNLQGFDASQHGDMQSFEAVPDGLYTAIAVESEFRDTKNGENQYLQIQWNIIEGEHEGRMLWSRYNLVNKNAKAVEIAQKELATACRAMGKPGVVNDSSELHNIPLVLDVGQEEYNGKMQNRIRGYHAATNAKTTAQVKQESTSGEQKKMPWQK